MRSITVTAATPVVLTSDGSNSRQPGAIDTPLTVMAVPGSGGTLLVEYQVVEDGSWAEWPDGTVTAVTDNKLDGSVFALRFTAAVATGIVEINP